MENKVFSDQFGTHDMSGWLGEKTSFSIPSNYQIGNAGNSGEKTSATHLHFEFQKVKR